MLKLQGSQRPDGGAGAGRGPVALGAPQYLHPLLVPPKNAFQLRPCARNSTSAPPWGLKLWCPGQGCTALSSLIRLQVTPHLWASVYPSVKWEHPGVKEIPQSVRPSANVCPAPILTGRRCTAVSRTPTSLAQGTVVGREGPRDTKGHGAGVSAEA